MVPQRLAVPSIAVAIALPASAGLVQPGVFVSRTDLAAGTYESRIVHATGYGGFEAVLGPTAAALTWTPSSASFAGSCSGTALLIARSQGIAAFVLGEPMTFRISFDMTEVVSEGSTVGWGLVDTATTEPVHSLSYEDGVATSVGGVDVAARGQFKAAVSPGSYLLVMLAETSTAGGSFNFEASLSQIPGPGAYVVLLVAGTIAPARRRR